MKKFISIAILIILVISCNSKIDLSLPSVFSDQMILQRETEVTFWGKSSSNEKIEIKGTWGKSSSTKADKSGNWELKLITPSAGGPYEVVVNDSRNSIVFKDVLIGEVWLASGQSNMQWKLNQCKDCIDNQDEEIENANYNEIRFFNNPTDLSGTIINSQKWKTVNPKSASEMEDSYSTENYSAVGYFFAKKLYSELNVPIGIIGSYWGGTRVEAWTSRAKLNEITSVKLPIEEIKKIISMDREELELFYKNYNDSVANINKELFGFDTFDLPKITQERSIEKNWELLSLNDKHFPKADFNDTKWQNWNKNYEVSGYGDLNSRFENIYDPKDFLLNNGVIWLRTLVNIEDISSDYELIYKDGADDTDQTYFNGTLVGNTFSWSKERNYTIKKSLLRKGENLLAIRLSDLDGPGGFNGKIFIRNSSDEIEIPIESFKYKHHAFLLDGRLIVHNLENQELLEKSNFFKENIVRGFATDTHNEYSILFDRILSNVIPYTIKGTIWYQGEANTINYNEYQTLFSAMIDDWREAWEYDFPFYYAQLAPFPAGGTLGVREAQRKTLESTENTGMAVLMDIGEEDDIHPHNKQDVGKRLALLALDKQYGFNYISSGPKYKSHKAKGRYLYVDFDSVGSGLDFIGGKNGFEIAGKNNKFYPATAKIIDNRIRLYSKDVKRPINVRYGWKNWTVGTLFNKEGLPASSFSSGL